jgi:hypothetical protein
MRKGQAALEFLTTYGWAFLVILVMIGALAYFGVLNPSKALPPKCLAEAGWDCKDYIIHETDFSINLVNRKGDSLKLVDITSISSDSNLTAIPIATCTINGVFTPVTVAMDGQMIISCPTTAGMFTGLKGQKVKIDLVIAYTLTRGTYAQTFPVEIQSTVQ